MTHPDQMEGLDVDDAAELAAAIEEVSHCANHLLRAQVLLDSADTIEDVETYANAIVFWTEQLAAATRDRDAWIELVGR